MRERAHGDHLHTRLGDGADGLGGHATRGLDHGAARDEGDARAQIVVAAVDAIGIAVGAWFLDLPLVLPIFVLVFVCAFVPIIGTAIAGIVPTLIAFVAHDPGTALLMLGIVLLV